MATKFDAYQHVTDQVLAMMQQHGADWINPFQRKGGITMPRNIASKKAYRGINILLLGWSRHASVYWGSFNQWRERDCQVRKGEKGTKIVFWQFLEKDDAKTGEKVSIPLLRVYTVFNAEQVEGDYAQSLLNPTVEGANEVDDIAAAEDFFRRTGASISHTDKGQAYYSPSTDHIHMPLKAVFEATPTSTATECYYSTLAHETIHWTGHKSRLDRLKLAPFGSEEYAREELVAEIGAAILCAHLGISASPRPDHAQYLNAWMKKLSDDKRAFVTAASAAAKAFDFVVETAEAEVLIAA